MNEKGILGRNELKLQSPRYGAFKISKDPFDCGPVLFSGFRHVLAHLVH